MMTRKPPRLAVWLLERLGPGDEPLAGDLLEAFGAGASGFWFWRQVVAALLLAPRRGPREIRPLRLVDTPPELLALATTPRRFNLGAGPVYGVGGLGLTALGLLVTVVAPQAWWVVLGSMLGGVVLGICAIAIRRRRPPART